MKIIQVIIHHYLKFLHLHSFLIKQMLSNDFLKESININIILNNVEQSYQNDLNNLYYLKLKLDIQQISCNHYLYNNLKY